jgi:hypothetical protein
MTPPGAICAWLLLLSIMPLHSIRTMMEEEDFAVDDNEVDDGAEGVVSAQSDDGAMHELEEDEGPDESDKDSVDCDQFKDVKVEGIDFGRVAPSICQVWPGTFPATNKTHFERIMGKVMDKGGIYDTWKTVSKTAKKDWFCFRNRTWREDGCPHGFKPQRFVPDLNPVCTSVCAESNHPVPCGLGCASTAGHCFLMATKHLRKVGKGTALALTLLTGNPVFKSSVSKLSSMLEFATRTLWKVFRVGHIIYRADDIEEAILGAIVSLYQIIYADIKWNLKGYKVTGKVFKFLYKLIKTRLGEQWQQELAKLILKTTPTVFTTAWDLTKTFTGRTCEVADESVLFTIEKAGDEQILGPWMKRGKFHGKYRYVRVNNAQTKMQWSQWDMSWGIWVKEGFAGLGWRRLYKTTFQSETFPTRGWEVDKGEYPAPSVFSSEDDGETLDGHADEEEDDDQ